MFKRILIPFIIFLLALSGLTLHNRVEDLQWQLDQTNNRIVSGLSSMVYRVMPSVVYIEATVDDYEYGYGWSGSGVIIGPHTVLTAKHVIEDANSLMITIADGNTYEAVEWKVDPNNDCGLLFFEEELSPIIRLADSDKIKIGDKVAVIGSPFGYDFFNTVTTGIVSGLDREILFFGEVPLITVDAAANFGNSGGPVFDMQGRVIGIIVGGMWDADGFGIVTPVNICKELYETATKIKSQTN